ncbi:unnamed protein product [Caenorhabditis angaria]|uniref:DUF7808 domain-containing protein n=1 Tax=Caenorhabditis angaria TaxID=860376 RepID=A0A9P1IQ01_9PELO|nr:unnamed protein product [Caenorhabditis angaria]
MFVIFVFSFFICLVNGSYRYENRTIDCDLSKDQCVLTAPDTKIKNLDLKVQCFRDEKKRLNCPIRCPKENEVHVLFKIPSSNKKCVKFYTYGKLQGETEWLVWMIEPCQTIISTHCRYLE